MRALRAPGRERIAASPTLGDAQTQRFAMYAVIRSGAKQYRITEGDVLRIEKIAGDVGAEVAFEQVLLVGGSGEPKVGRPTLSGAKVTGKILAQKRQRRGLPFRKGKGRWARQGGESATPIEREWSSL